MNKRFYKIFLFANLISALMFAQVNNLTVRGFSQGYYRPTTGKMKAVIDSVNLPLICDTAIIGLIDTVTNQTQLCLSTLINTDGYGTVAVPSWMNNQYYFVSIKFRNTLHVVSETPVLISGNSQTVDLTVLQNVSRYFLDTTYGITKAYSGDIDFDWEIGSLDMVVMEYSIYHNLAGYCLPDLNGDSKVNSLDMDILEANVNVGAADIYRNSCVPTFSFVSNISNLESQSFTVNPNPASAELNIFCNACAEQKIQITFFDVTGRAVKKIMELMDEKGLNIDVRSMTPGLYFLTLQSEDGVTRTSRIVIE